MQIIYTYWIYIYIHSNDPSWLRFSQWTLGVCVCVCVSPGRGTAEKLCVRAERRVSRCCCRRPFRVRSWCTSPSRRSTAERMLSTCFCSAALRSSYSILFFLSCRSSASRATTHNQWTRFTPLHTDSHIQQHSALTFTVIQKLFSEDGNIKHRAILYLQILLRDRQKAVQTSFTLRTDWNQCSNCHRLVRQTRRITMFLTSSATS